MEDFKGTPGKWYIDPTWPKSAEIHIESPHNATIIATLYCDPMDEETHANAKMCCASKEMAGALQAVVTLYEETGYADLTDSEKTILELAKAALSKAID